MGIQSNISTFLALISVSMLWGTSFAAAKIGLHELAPLNLVIFRFILASAFFIVILKTQRKPSRIHRKDIPTFFALGFLAVTSYFYIQFTGLQYTTTINSALIIATSPIFIAIFGWLLGWEKPTPTNIGGIFIAFIGVAIAITNGQLNTLLTTSTLKGDLLLLLNAVVWAGFTLYGRNLLQKYRPFIAMAYIHICGTLLLIPFAFFPSLMAPVPFIYQIQSITWPTITAGLYLSILCSVYAYHIWYIGVEQIGAIRTGVFSYLNPLFSIIAGVILLQENFSIITLIGSSLIISGVYITNK